MANEYRWPDVSPDPQAARFHRLEELRNRHFAEALRCALQREQLCLETLNAQLGQIVGPSYLRRLAEVGLRGEQVFAVPHLLELNPHLVGYYRLLYGISRKQFYKADYSRFQKLEDDGVITEGTSEHLLPFCASLAGLGEALLDHLDINLGPPARETDDPPSGSDLILRHSGVEGWGERERLYKVKSGCGRAAFLRREPTRTGCLPLDVRTPA